MSRRSNFGFTLIELLIYVAIFAIVAGFFTSILLITLRVQGTQTGAVEVGTQLNFAMQTIQRYIRDASASGITTPAVGATGSTLTMNNATITLCGTPANQICVNSQPVTTSKILVTSLKFSHYTTPSSLPCPGTPCVPDGHTITIAITATNNTTNPASLISRTLQSSASPLNQ